MNIGTALPRRTRFLAAIAVTATALALAACGSGKQQAHKASYSPNIDPAEFSTVINNPYFPLIPGTRFTYRTGGKDGPEQGIIVVDVTHETKQVDGVTCVVVRDTLNTNGKVTEDTRDWYAQDREGNVWYFGEDTKAIKSNGKADTAGSWQAGVRGAEPGIVMKANPQVGDSYRQEYYKGHAEDSAKVLSVTETQTVPLGSYSSVLVTEETSALEPGVVERKYYARGVGDIREADIKGGSDHAELVSVEHH